MMYLLQFEINNKNIIITKIGFPVPQLQVSLHKIKI